MCALRRVLQLQIQKMFLFSSLQHIGFNIIIYSNEIFEELIYEKILFSHVFVNILSTESKYKITMETA